MWGVLQPFRVVSGYHFRKQVPIGTYVADFVCHHAMLVIEVDGEQHENTRRNDQLRDDYMRARGYKVLRVLSTELMDNHQGVYALIAAMLANIRPSARRARAEVTPSPVPREAPSTLPLAGRVAEPGPSGPGAAREGGKLARDSKAESGTGATGGP
jgi:very-short-patch-repair endonuclease